MASILKHLTGDLVSTGGLGKPGSGSDASAGISLLILKDIITHPEGHHYSSWYPLCIFPDLRELTDYQLRFAL